MGGGRLRPASEPEWQCLQWVVGKGPKESGGAGRVTRAPSGSGISQGRTVCPFPSLAGRSEQREAPEVSLTERQQTACLLGHPGPCSGCCPHSSQSAGQDPRFALCQTGWKWRRAQQSSRPRPQYFLRTPPKATPTNLSTRPPQGPLFAAP